MANRIKGITVEIGGDTTKLQTALKGVNGQIKSTLPTVLNLAAAGGIDLREQKQNLMTKSAEREVLKQRVAEMKEFLNEQIGKIEEYDESLVRRILEKVTIYDSYFTMEFKSGVSVDIRR